MRNIKIIVLVKEILSTEQKLVKEKLNQFSDLEYTINIYDEYAIEEVISIKEKFGGEVVIYSVGSKSTRKMLNYYMSMGADRVELLITNNFSSKNILDLLEEKIKEKDDDFSLIIGGHVGIDLNRGEIPGRLSARFRLPFLNVISNLEVEEVSDTILCVRETENGNETLKSPMPAVITVQRGINNPRFPIGRNIFSDKSDRIFETEKNILEEEKHNFEEKIQKRKSYMVDGSSAEEKIDNLILLLKENKLL